MDARMGLTVGMVLLAAIACAPDDPLDHPCLEGSSLYNECQQVEPGGECTFDSQCKWSDGNGKCSAGICVCATSCQPGQCGDDGCGGSCGECVAPSFCVNRSCCDPVANCQGRICGDDGCGGNCGFCGVVDVCVAGLCCTPDCGENECGDNGCAGSCGDCGANSQCLNGKCECAPNCESKECGADGCGGSCGGGECQTCSEDGRCLSPWWTDPASELRWQNPPAQDRMAWSPAIQYCSALVVGATDDWRLPGIGELRSLIRGCPATESGGTCNVKEGQCLGWSCKDSSCGGCPISEGPASGCYWSNELLGTCESPVPWYWSSAMVDSRGEAWGVSFRVGMVYVGSVGSDRNVRCVR